MLKICGVVGGGWVVGGLQQFSVSPRPLGYWFFSFWVWGLRVWGQGLTIRSHYANVTGFLYLYLLPLCVWIIVLQV